MSRTINKVNSVVVFDNGDSVRPEYDQGVAAAAAALARLRELYVKGWSNLTATERAEVPRLVLEALVV